MGVRKMARNLKDDDGSFDRLKKKAAKLANGDPKKALNLLTEMVVHDFLTSLSTKQKNPVDLLAFQIPKKQRGSCGYPTAEELMVSSVLLLLKEPSSSSLMDKEMKRELTVDHDHDHKENELMEEKVGKIYNVKLEKPKLMAQKMKRELTVDRDHKEKEVMLMEEKVGKIYNGKLEKPNKRKGKRRRVAKNDDDDEEEKQKKNKKQKVQVPENLVKPPGLPVHLLSRIEDMGVYSVPQLLIQKYVYTSDMNPKLTRFSIPLRAIKHTSFMKEAEILKDRPFDITLIDSSNMNEYATDFKKWHMNSNFTYNLVHDWPLVLKNKVVKQGDWVQLWWFRRNSKLCLLLVNLQDGKRDVVSCSNSGCGEAGSSSGRNATQSCVTEEQH